MKRSIPETSPTPAKRSRTSCSQCRQRKIKCDESTPTCGPCRKSSRLCEQRPWIIFHKERLRENHGQQSLFQSKKGSRSVSSISRSTADTGPWVQIPEKVVFVSDSEFGQSEQNNGDDSSETLAFTASTLDSTTLNHHRRPETEGRPVNIPPNLDESHNGEENLRNTDGDEYLSSIRQDQPSKTSHRLRDRYLQASNHDRIAQLSPKSTSLTKFTPTGGVEPHVDNIIRPSIQLLGEEEEEEDDDGEGLAEDLLEIAFLLRHFSETPGQWMDLFDLDCYFARQVPILARKSRLLRYAACAYAAKQLGRVDGRKTARGGVTSRQARMEVFPKGNKADWYYRGNKYYDKALSLLRNLISPNGKGDFPSSRTLNYHHQTPSTASDREDARQLNGPENGLPSVSKQLQEMPDTNTTVIAAAVLCVYEFLDAANVEWAGHLDGTKSLLDIAFANNGGLFSPQNHQVLTSIDSPTRSLTPSKARKAVFWNFARQDFLAAFINETTTRLDTEDIELWRTAGLDLDGGGFIRSSRSFELDHAIKQEPMREDMISNALIWLLSKIVNFLVSNGPSRHTSDVGHHSGDQQKLTNNNPISSWKRLQEEVDIWFNGLPETFQASAEILATRDARYNEIWYSIPMCASTMQSYHMARILLLINKPEDTNRTGSSVLNMIHSYRDIEEELRYHCSKICGIALGRPEGATRVHMLQPLYVAGLCLTDIREQRIVADLLREIETDLGWATGYRVRRLMEVWKWEEKGIPSMARN